MNQINSSRPDALCMTVRIVFDKRIKQKLSVLSYLGEPLQCLEEPQYSVEILLSVTPVRNGVYFNSKNINDQKSSKILIVFEIL